MFGLMFKKLRPPKNISALPTRCKKYLVDLGHPFKQEEDSLTSLEAEIE